MKAKIHTKIHALNLKSSVNFLRIFFANLLCVNFLPNSVNFCLISPKNSQNLVNFFRIFLKNSRNFKSPKNSQKGKQNEL